MGNAWLALSRRETSSSLMSGEDREYVSWVRTRPCGAPSGACNGPIQAHHAGLDRGLSQRAHEGRGAVGKIAVLALRERGESGRTVGFPVASVDSATIHAEIRAHVEAGSTLHTDEAVVYNGLEPAFKHESINHSAHEFARGDVTTNGIESFNALLKRGILGVYHHVTPKHLPRYVNEFSFRLNEGNVRNHTTQRLDSLIRRSAGKRLTLEALTNA
jgi:transposase-like protein